MNILITGVAGFIGSHLANRLLQDGHVIFGFDGVTPYYDVRLKRDRLAALEKHEDFHFTEAMLENMQALETTVAAAKADVVIHLAGQAGVRYSMEAPDSYISSNILGTSNLTRTLERHPPKHLMFASTSSVYGIDSQMPLSEVRAADHPISLYAATKKSAEMITHVFAHLHKVPTTCFRFFTVYGPSARPDMALYKFANAIFNDTTIDVFGGGNMRRDFTYVEDLVEAIVHLMGKAPELGNPVNPEIDTLSGSAPWRVVNIGSGRPIDLMDFIEAIEDTIGKRVTRKMLPMQPGDVFETYCDRRLLTALIGDIPQTSLRDGIATFVEWYATYRVSQPE